MKPLIPKNNLKTPMILIVIAVVVVVVAVTVVGVSGNYCKKKIGNRVNEKQKKKKKNPDVNCPMYKVQHCPGNLSLNQYERIACSSTN